LCIQEKSKREASLQCEFGYDVSDVQVDGRPSRTLDTCTDAAVLSDGPAKDQFEKRWEPLFGEGWWYPCLGDGCVCGTREAAGEGVVNNVEIVDGIALDRDEVDTAKVKVNLSRKLAVA
jgi:hypothetical protein